MSDDRRNLAASAKQRCHSRLWTIVERGHAVGISHGSSHRRTSVTERHLRSKRIKVDAHCKKVCAHRLGESGARSGAQFDMRIRFDISDVIRAPTMLDDRPERIARLVMASWRSSHSTGAPPRRLQQGFARWPGTRVVG
jgi:hypothetical protein